jgi:UDP-N-acetylmuramate dehydrogenase
MELLDPSIQNSCGISLGTSGSASNNISTVDTKKTDEINKQEDLNKENLSPHRSSRVFFESEAEKNVSRDVADQALIKSGAGVIFQDLINFCLDNNMVGLEEFSGIPGTVGGSVFINIHYFEFLLSQFLESAEVINKNSGEILTVDKNWFNFGYNYSQLHEEKYYLISATFKLKKVTELEAAYSRGRSHEIARQRAKKYPVTNTCGSFFRNFHDHEVTLVSNNKKLIYVAYYLDKIGVKGTLSVGDAIVSYQHANMIVNRGGATSSDIINLVKTMQQLVKENYNITPQPECRLIGFKEYPLLK